MSRGNQLVAIRAKQRRRIMTHIGVNIYWWGEMEQQRLLRDGVRSWAVQARRARLAHGLWYCLFDARGPHVFLLLWTRKEMQTDLLAFLETEIRHFCEHVPSRVLLSPDELAQRHRECRGRVLCQADRAERLANNNTFEVFTHEPDGYPLWFSAGMANTAEFWRSMDALAFQNLERLVAGGLQTAAIRCLASVDGALDKLGFRTEPFWRLYASTLILPLSQRSSIESGVLQRALGEHNRAIFDRLWNERPEDPAQQPGIGRLVKLILSDDGLPLEQRYRVLRELTHSVLAQLFQTADRRIPMVLYAWQRSLMQ
jgi:hypothetical protein